MTWGSTGRFSWLNNRRVEKCRHCGQPIIYEWGRWAHVVKNVTRTQCRSGGKTAAPKR